MRRSRTTRRTKNLRDARHDRVLRRSSLWDRIKGYIFGDLEDPSARVAVLEGQMERLRRQLVSTRNKLRYAREKNTLYQKLLDDADVDTTYVKSKRRIQNLQPPAAQQEKDTVKTLPPSPKRPVAPLVTSSPIRTKQASKPGRSNLVENPPLMSDYHKFKSLPTTESMQRSD
ncbi:Csa1p KNAG_0F03860 [Huiozyma naganishii CBS 8797]|uniref:Uncharacterized protein n=1 Tax=Huiozyma naganishii (strain ATCC MYA-139 / BCRC 22969 / CBS 8797 / KCTC 17520 / NBRC 10181 / NCYC 3082 / Yp74L-3) TaxID=1071383 RepID=J7R867_HUIN7|nr:hypothetical protein KNAG_0F03860 [Kazachstania naganishii CBS 8797]CCK71050.1 hypothetical protein KNAG_0F03860 [Kazachstania naganishii CBS 8797]